MAVHQAFASPLAAKTAPTQAGVRTDQIGTPHLIERYRHIFEHDLTGDFVARPDGTIILCNPAFARIFGFASVAEANGSNLLSLQSKARHWRDLARDLARNPSIARHTAEWVRLDGSTVHIVMSLASRYDDRGTLAEVQGYVFDDTERTLAAREVARHREELERLVREQTEQLRESYEQIRLSDRLASIGTLAAGLGHDMNNVLLPARAHLNALRSGSLGRKYPGARGSKAATDPSIAPTREHFHALSQSIAHLQSLADGLHYLSMDPENTSPDGAPTAIGVWWKQVGCVISKALPRSVTLRTSFPRSLPPVTVAPHRLTQAILNLVVNAGEAVKSPTTRKPTRRGTCGVICVWAKARSTAQPLSSGENWVTIGVTDNGRGMDAETKRRAFELFFTTKPRGVGTGLGLALVNRVASRVGGSVHIDSQPGKGTTVSMILPAAREASPARRSSQRCTTVISLRDGRAATMARAVLEAADVTVRSGQLPGDASIWLVDPTAPNLARARRWVRKKAAGRAKRVRPPRALIVLGTVPTRQKSAWVNLAPAAVVPGAFDLEDLRAAIGAALDQVANPRASSRVHGVHRP